MRRCTAHLHFALFALAFTIPLRAEDAITRVAPTVRVPFRGVALGRDMNLRESPAETTPSKPLGIARQSPPAETSSPVTAVAKAVPLAPLLPRQKKLSPPRKPAIATVGKATPPPSSPARSALPPRAETPASALPPGGRELALQPTTFTPYDRYLGSVRAVISNLELHEATKALTARLMKEGRRFKYCVSDPYRADLPALTAARQAGDCKSKALWLYDNLGDSNALFVIGKAEKRAKNSHAWVYWRNDERWWILDCTERSDPIAADSVSSDRYVPYYSFGRSGAYRHKATRLILTGGVPTNPSQVAGLR